MSFETPESLAIELCTFTENNGQIYRSQTSSILKNLATKKASGKYDREKAVQAFMYLAETGARAFAKDSGAPESSWHDMFPINVRRIAATRWRDEFEGEYDLGNYDNLVPKKYQKPALRAPKKYRVPKAYKKAASPVRPKGRDSLGWSNEIAFSEGADLATRVASNLTEDEITKICLDGRDPPGGNKHPEFKRGYLRRMMATLDAMRGN